MHLSPLTKIWLDLCFLKAGPQELPASYFLLSLTVTCYLVVNTIISLPSLGAANSIGIAVLDVLLLAAFLHLLLKVRGLGARFTQTLSALTGTGTMMAFLALPLVPGLQRSAAEKSGGELNALLWLGLMIWSLMILGHILRHTLSTTLAVGMMLGVAYTMLSIFFIQILFPEAS